MDQLVPGEGLLCVRVLSLCTYLGVGTRQTVRRLLAFAQKSSSATNESGLYAAVMNSDCLLVSPFVYRRLEQETEYQIVKDGPIGNPMPVCA